VGARRRFKEERGASAVEFAIVASLLFLILFGTITFGLVLNRYQGLQAAGREAARLGSLSTTTRGDIVTRAKQSVSIIRESGNAPDGQPVWSDPCPNPLQAPNLNIGQGFEHGCIDVFIRPDPAAAEGSWVRYTNDADVPCSHPAGTAPAVIVQVWYRLRIDVPLWASPKMTLKGVGEFRCEVGGGS
jgi:Flp pilus assembly pilin Flp